MPAGWTIQQITHCSETLACSDSLPVNSTASALGEADLISSATIARQVGKTAVATMVTAATLAAQPAVTYPQALTATAVASTATIATVHVTPVVPGTDAQDVAALVAAVAGGVGE
jgi:hypothetical protein